MGLYPFLNMFVLEKANAMQDWISSNSQPNMNKSIPGSEPYLLGQKVTTSVIAIVKILIHFIENKCRPILVQGLRHDF